VRVLPPGEKEPMFDALVCEPLEATGLLPSLLQAHPSITTVLPV
jgi:hypothetical protein